MIESYIENGNQPLSEHTYGKSITDPCLGWDLSKELIYEIADQAWWNKNPTDIDIDMLPVK